MMYKNEVMKFQFKYMFIIFWCVVFSLHVLATTEMHMLEGEKLQLGEFQKVIINTNDSSLAKYFETLKNPSLFNENFYFYQKSFIKEDPKNNWQIGLVIICKKIPASKMITLELDKNKYLVDLKLEQVASENLQPSYQQADFKWNSSWWLDFWHDYSVYLVLFFILMVSVFTIIVRLVFQKKKLREMAKKEKAYWVNKIKLVQTRKDLEFLYAHKNKWIDLITESKVMKDFLSAMDSIQYLPAWEDSHREFIDKYLKKLQRSIKE